MARGLVHIYTGDGKGKTTASLGLSVRACGAGKKVLIVQFLKGQDTSELVPLKELGITVIRSDILKFVPFMSSGEKEDCRLKSEQCFKELRERMADYDMVVLDEILCAISTHMIDLQAVAELIKSKPEQTEMILTGRGAPRELIDLADYVSDIQSVKHPFEQGIAARKGIEF